MDDDATVKHSVCAVFENAVIKLPACAVRTAVLHQHVIVEMLPAAAYEQSIYEALAAFARKDRMHIVAHKPAAQQQRVRSNVRAASLLDAQRRKVVGLHVFALDH